MFEHITKGNCIAIVSDSSRVLGLGDIGPQAVLPVVEGKAILFKYLGGVDAFPLFLATNDADDIIQYQHLGAAATSHKADVGAGHIFDYADLRRSAAHPTRTFS